MQTFQDRLRALREDNDLSQEVVARFLGTSQTMYSQYERGVYEMPMRHVIHICTLYNVSADDLLGVTVDQRRKQGIAKL